MREIIDARGLACPQPVVLVKNKMKNSAEIEVLVDNDAAFENIRRLASASGYSLKHEKSGGDYHIYLIKKEGEQNLSVFDESIPSCSGTDTVVVISSDVMGSGDDDLGRLLLKAFINTLTKTDMLPSRILFYNSGVKIAAAGSGSDDDLEFLFNNGVELLICGTCVNYFELQGKIKTGIISNMFDIVNILNNAGRIVRP